MPADETATVELTLTDFELVSIGRIKALASITIGVGGIEFELRGVRVIEDRRGQVTISGPTFRGTRGEWIPATVLPAEIREPLGRLVGDAFYEAIGWRGLAIQIAAS